MLKYRRMAEINIKINMKMCFLYPVAKVSVDLEEVCWATEGDLFASNNARLLRKSDGTDFGKPEA